MPSADDHFTKSVLTEAANPPFLYYHKSITRIEKIDKPQPNINSEAITNVSVEGLILGLQS